MPRGYDHLTLVVTDLGEATRFLAILGFRGDGGRCFGRDDRELHGH